MSDTLSVVFLGHVDHGKSTLIARLLLDSGVFPDGRFEELQAACERRGVPMEISFLLDAFQVERDQAVTIDSTRIWLPTAKRSFAFIDAPGHKEFVRHMVSGAWEGDLGVVLVDAQEGVSEQTRRHVLLLSLLNVRQALLVVNKMDAVEFEQRRFEAIVAQVQGLHSQWGIDLVGAVPAVARDGDNVVLRSERMAWYQGATLMEFLEQAEQIAGNLPLRFAIQDVYRRQEQRVLVGTARGKGIATGTLLQFLPGGYSATVTHIVRYSADTRDAKQGESIGLIVDQPLFLQPGDVGALAGATPSIALEVEATVFWLSAQGLQLGEKLSVRLGTRDAIGTLVAIHEKIDMDTLEYAAADSVQNNDICHVRIRFESPMIVDTSAGSPLSQFAFYRGHYIAGGGVVTSVVAEVQPVPRSANVFAEPHLVTQPERAARFGHRGGVVWLTGLPASGKSTIARSVERRLFSRGWNVFVLDGDTLRTGLNGDLGFTIDERRENVRRVGEVAALFAKAGTICIVALVSPVEADRERARRACPAGPFHEIYIRTPLEICEKRDPKGLYKRARLGEIPEFTGITSPYEAPRNPQMTIETSTQSVDE
ncbi:MAG: adenylyl-sulfate kinase, partial [Candidatus Eremiobacteraeota bacterium]|nr:adenylyl-sulfate kinase [Candidatus Eremiobacteraeota bacterium]